MSEHTAHVSDTRYVPRPDWSVCTLETFAFWRQLEASVNGTLELYSGSWGEGWSRGWIITLRSIPTQQYNKNDMALQLHTVQITTTCILRINICARTTARIWKSANQQHWENYPQMWRLTNLQVTMHFCCFISQRQKVCLVCCQQTGVKI